jgi:ribose transport system ATP-binding protein
MQLMKLIKTPEGIPLHFVAHYMDITERKQAEDQLKKYTETLTVLLREVNHRVKNNLAALISMLHMEQNKANITRNTGYIDFLNDLISRIQSLSTVHSMLSAQSWQPLELNSLCSQVIQGAISGTPPDKKVQTRITPSKIKVNSNQAHHLTLVINELATNAVKHAMHGREKVLLSVDISSKGEDIRISFKDDGPGFPETLLEGDFSKANIGFELIRGIVTQSLDGELKLLNNHGATAVIIFQNELNS